MNLTDETRLRAEAMRGQRAAELMGDEIMVEAFTLMDARFKEEWANSPARDTEGRERIWLMQKLLTQVKSHLVEVAMTGKLASIQLEQHRTVMQRAKEWAKEQF